MLRETPDYGRAHVGLANACSLLYESMRFDAKRDESLVATAVAAAYRGCELEPSWAEAWITLAFALFQRGDMTEAAAAACRAVDLDGDDWRHALRLGYISWGEERLRAARRVLQLCPNIALAYWLMDMVWIARGTTDAAFDIVRKGCAAEDAQFQRRERFPGVGLHLQHALLLGATGNVAGAIGELERERACVGDLRHIYARECAANTAYTLGAFRRRLGQRAEADASFLETLQIAPGHLSAAAALGRGPDANAAREPNTIDIEIAIAVGLAREGRHADAARVCSEALEKAPPGYAGWILPVEPFLDAAAHPNVWAPTLAAVCLRAT